MRGKPWGPNDRTGGVVDDVLDSVRAAVPGLIVERLEPSYPGDDDNVYFLADGLNDDFVQMDTNPRGEPPFVIDTSDPSDGRFETSGVAAASARVVDWFVRRRPELHLSDPAKARPKG